MTEPKLVFKDPPGRATTYVGGRWVRLGEPLKEYPGRWVLLGEFSSNEATNGARCLKKKGFDFSTSKVSDTHRELYARWPASENGQK